MFEVQRIERDHMRDFNNKFLEYVSRVVETFKQIRRKSEWPANKFLTLYNEHGVESLAQQVFQDFLETVGNDSVSKINCDYNMVRLLIEQRVEELKELILEETKEAAIRRFEDIYYYVVPNTSSREYPRGSISKTLIPSDHQPLLPNVQTTDLDTLTSLFIDDFQNFSIDTSSGNLYGLHRKHLDFLVPIVKELFTKLKEDITEKT